VAVSEVEMVALAAEVELTPDQFRAAYTRESRDGEISLRERRDGSCVFYDRSRGCSVYAVRPRQCRSFPFWRSVMVSKERWDAEARACPGMNRGTLHAADEIESISRADGTLSSARAERGRG